MKLTKVELKSYRERLLAIRARLRGDIHYLAEAALKPSGAEESSSSSKMPIHMADIGSENYAQEFALSLMANDEGTLSEVEAALERIEDGQYGNCEGCSKPIKKTRLNAIPYASLCIECAQSRERH